MSDRQSIVSDPAIVRARAMETLFERLESLCEGAIAIDRAGRVVYVNEKYLHALRLDQTSEAIGRPIEEIIPNSLMRRVAETGEPILLDIMELGGEHLVVTRMPIEDEDDNDHRRHRLRAVRPYRRHQAPGCADESARKRAAAGEAAIVARARRAIHLRRLCRRNLRHCARQGTCRAAPRGKASPCC